jgi:hypothetical protein
MKIFAAILSLSFIFSTVSQKEIVLATDLQPISTPN